MMRSVLGVVGALALASIVAGVRPADAQAVGSIMRGKVFDSTGAALEGVNIEFTFKGGEGYESRVPISRKATSDKKGAWIRSGLRSGNWKVTFTKTGYKPFTTETFTSGDSLSELPDVKLAAAPAGEQTPTSAAEVEKAAKERELMKKLGATYTAGVEAMKAKDYPGAEALFRQVLAAQPNLGEVHHNLGYLRMLQNDAAGAEVEFRLAIEKNPATAGDSYMALGTLLTGQGKSAEALALLSGVKESFAADGKFQFALGVVASNAGKDTEAQEAFSRAAELDPANAETQYYLGTLALGRNDLPGAIAYLEKYVATAPEAAPNVPTAKALIETLKKKKK